MHNLLILVKVMDGSDDFAEKRLRFVLVKARALVDVVNELTALDKFHDKGMAIPQGQTAKVVNDKGMVEVAV
jgi:hypothetical protein